MSEISNKSECKEAFDFYDKENKGSIYKEQLIELIRALGAWPTQSQINDLLREVKVNSSDKIEFNEFMEVYLKQMKNQDTEADLINAFKIFDKDNLGFVAKDEFKHVMTTLGEKLTDIEANEMMKEADPNGEGKILYKEFIKLMFTK